MFVIWRHTCVRKLLSMVVHRTLTQPFGDFRSTESNVRLDLVMGNPPSANVCINGLRVNRQESRKILSGEQPVGILEIVEDIGLGAGCVLSHSLLCGRPQEVPLLLTRTG